ncbi:hypothetical protein HDU97_010378 [Phlyctochytrium planicorne]|nr:hypothetical protein HDU97_010378 [Phlyctochytrium planicorne]
MSLRPPAEKRCFVSPSVETKIQEVKKSLLSSTKFSPLATLFEQTWPNTLDTTVSFHSPATEDTLPDSFVITGDIPASWLRDGANQVFSYIKLVHEDPKLQVYKHMISWISERFLKDLVLGVIMRQAKCIQSHPFSNAFRFSPESPPSDWGSDRVHPPLDKDNFVWESKYELDSWAAFLKLAAAFYQACSKSETETGKRGQVLARLMCENAEFIGTLKTILSLMVDLQISTFEEELTGGPLYRFIRSGDVPTDTL